MSAMKEAADIKTDDGRSDSSDDELAHELKKEQFNLRFQRANGQLENTGRIRVVRRDIARIKTIAEQKRRGSRRGKELKRNECQNACCRASWSATRMQDRGGEGRTPLHPSGDEEDRAPVEEISRP